MEAFNGSLMPYAQMPYGYRWLYWVSPFQHYVRSMLGELLHNLPIECADFEVVSFATPPNSTCGSYAQEFLSTHVGYLLDPSSTTICRFCPMSTGDDFLKSLNISHNDRWQSLSILALYSISNIVIAYLLVFFPPRVPAWVSAVWSRVVGGGGEAKGAEEVAQEVWIRELRHDQEVGELIRAHDAFA
jgi:ATP-binding cassette subfamily G (WHITE) protein 2 (SNQ2)